MLFITPFAILRRMSLNRWIPLPTNRGHRIPDEILSTFDQERWQQWTSAALPRTIRSDRSNFLRRPSGEHQDQMEDAIEDGVDANQPDQRQYTETGPDEQQDAKYDRDGRALS